MIMNEFIFLFLVIVPLIISIIGGVIIGIILRERNARKEAEQELEATRKSLKELCEVCIKENNSVYARIIYESYFGRPVDHTGDGFINGYQ